MKNMNRISIAIVNNNSLPLLRERRNASAKFNRGAVAENTVKANFLTSVSHELRTPLNSINGAIHYLQNRERPVTGQEREFYDIISSEAAKLVGIIESLLGFLRSEQDAKKALMQIFLEIAAEFLNLGICSVMVGNGSTGELAIAGAVGLDKDIIRNTRIRIGDPIAGWVALKGEPLLIKNIEKDALFKRNSISRYNTKSLLSLPLKVKDRVIGVINMNNKRTASSFTDDDLKMASMLADRLSRLINILYKDDSL